MNLGNVVWLDDISAARALLGLSVQITDLQPVPSQHHSDSDSDVEMTQSSKGNSIGDENLSEVSYFCRITLLYAGYTFNL